MKSWWKKALTFAVGVYAFSLISLYAAVDYNSAISDTANKLKSSLIIDNENYNSYSEAQKTYLVKVIGTYATEATQKQATWISTDKPNDKNQFIAKTLDDFASKIEATRSNQTSEIQQIIRVTSDKATSFSIEISNENTLSSDISGAPIAGDASKPTTSTTVSQPNSVAACSFEFTKTFSVTACIDGLVGWIVQFTIVNLSLWVFYFCSQFLQFTIAYGITSFGSLVGNTTSTTSGVYVLWLLMRNLVWTGVLFSLFYLAILQLFGKTHEFGRAVAMIVVFALFSGFSFRASLFLIDVSNVATVSLYKQVPADNSSEWSDKFTLTPVIGTRYINLLGYNTLSEKALATGQENSILGTAGGQGKTAINLILAATMLFNSYIMLMMGILFTVRNIALFAGVILSPLLLIDKVIPILKDPAEKFRKLFFGQLMFAPIFMLSMYVGLKISDIIKLSLQSAGNSSTFGLKIFNLIAISAIFYFTYDYCKKLSGAIGGSTINALGSLAQRAMIATPLGLAGRAGSIIGQNSVGALGRRLSREGGYLDRNRSGLMGLGEKAFNAARYAGNTATYDFNNSKVIANAGSKLGSFAGNKDAFSANNAFIVDKGNSFTDKEKAVRERLKYINENYTDEADKQKAIDRAIGDGGARDHVRPGGITLVGDTVLSKITNKARVANNDKSDLRSFAKNLSSNKIKSTVSDSFNEVDFENKDLDELSEEIAKLKKKAEKGGPDAQKIFNSILQKKLSSYFTSKIQSDKVLKNEDGTAIKITGTTSENFMKGVGLYMEGNAEKIATIINQGSTLSTDEQKVITDKFMENINETVTKTAENIWTTENEQKNKISKIEEERRAKTATSGPINLEKRRARKAAREQAAANEEQRNNSSANTQEQTESLRQAA